MATSLRSKAAGFIKKAGKSYSDAMGGPAINTLKKGGSIKSAVKNQSKAAGRFYKNVAMKATPIGVVASAIGLAKDKKAEKASKASAYKLHERLNNVRQNRSKAAKTLRKFKLKKHLTKILANPMNHVLTNKQINDIKASSTMSDATKNAKFERDMRKRGALGLPR